jgi:hypothetical protein
LILKRMKGQRREHKPGDLFVLQLASDDSFRFGRIVKMGQTTREARFPGEVLVYVYAPAFTMMVPDLDVLTSDKLLMPPFFTMRWMWHKGYFRTVGHEPLTAADLLAQHCFYSGHHDDYVDENDRQLDKRYEPCGWFSLSTFEQLDHEIGQALAGDPVLGRHSARDRL